MMKMYKKITFFMVVILWMIHATPIQAAQNSVIEKIIEEYMDARSAVLLYGETAQLSKCAVGGIVLDEKLHYDKMLENDINVLSSNYEIISIIESDIIIELVVEERLLFEYSNTTEEEIIEHIIGLMYNEAGKLLVVSDGYVADFSEFISASYVSEIVPYVAGSGSGNCVVTVAKSQIGYYEKETNSNLESFTANAGNKNYTKYGAWTGMNGQAWCASFVSWCANQAQVSSSIVPKTASCDVSMEFFKTAGRFYASATNGGTYRPQAGDIFFTGPSSDNATHTGIVVSINGTTITYVDGNGTGDVVKQRTMSWSNTSLLGFAHPAYTSSTHSWVNQSGYYQCLICGQTASTIPIAPASLNYE